MQDYNEFKRAIEFTIGWETAKGTRIYTNDPHDPGGETKWGISKQAHPSLDIKHLSREDALALYAKEYWDACGCDDIPFPLNCAVFDVAVMSGPSVAKDLARRSTSTADFINKRKQGLIAISISHRDQARYLNGWLNRTDDLKKFLDVNTPAVPKPITGPATVTPIKPVPQVEMVPNAPPAQWTVEDFQDASKGG